MSDNFNTQAGNFSTGLNSTVDPRTGLYAINLGLLSLAANNQLGPSVDLALTYNPLGSDDIGFGTGFSLGLTSYNVSTGTLKLSSGEQYRVSETGGQPVIFQRKLNTFIFRKTAEAYEVIWKNGVTEVLHGPGSAGALKYPVRIVSPAGRYVSLAWDHTGKTPRLTRLNDEFRTLLTVDYYGNISTVIHTFPASDEGGRLSLLFANNNLTSLTHYAADNTELKWTLSYQPVDSFYLLSGLTYPTGLEEQVRYQGQVMRFPEKSGLPALPAVVSLRRDPGAAQPAQETTWTWSDANYLGFGGIADWSPDNDFTYGIAGIYSYFSTETLTAAETTLITTRTYNKFHLLGEEKTHRDGTVTTQTVRYYADELKPFDQQPLQFLLPRETTETLTDTLGETRARTTQTRFDEQGNLLQQTEADGTVTTLSWYPPEGSEGCPAEPNGFTRFLKQKTVSYPNDAYPDVVDSTETYTYTTLGNTTCAVQDTQSLFSGSVLLQHKTTTYHTVPGSPEFGRISAIDETLYPENGGDSFTSRQVFSTTVSGTRLQQRATFSGHDGLTAITHRTSSALSGALFEETDALGVTTAYTYDDLGRLLHRTQAAGTLYEHATHWSYRMDGTPVTTETGPTGMQQETHFDGTGRVVRRRVRDVDTTQALYDVYAARYNTTGDVASETSQDWQIGDEGEPTFSSLTGNRRYGAWGEARTITTTDGLTSVRSLDPVGLTQTQQMQGLGREQDGARAVNSGMTKRHFDPVSLQLTHSEQRDAAGEVQGTTRYARDGRGLLRRIEDERGHITTFTYDTFGRERSRTLPDGSTVTRRYAPHLAEALVSAISVTGPDVDGNMQSWQLGTQAFDSLGRLTESASGGRITSYAYDGASPAPATVTLPSGSVLQYTYIPELGNAVSSLMADGVMQNFRYDGTTGALLQADEGNTGKSNVWTPAGHLKTEIFNEGDNRRQALHRSTLSGAPAAYTDITGKTTTYERDEFGRLIMLSDEALTVSLTYDALGRPHTRTVTDITTAATLVMTLEYDDFGREVTRTLDGGQGTMLTLEQSWLANSLLDRRITQQNNALLKDEQYEYDSRNRLVSYRVSGSAPSADAYGHLLAGQQYSYDALNNLSRVTSQLTDGSHDTAMFYYDNADDPTQLSRVTHTHGSYPQVISLEYDAEGRMIRDEAGRTLSYDVLGRLTSVSGTDVPGGHYGYDALNRLVSQKVNDGDIHALYYRGDELVNEILVTQQREIRLIKGGHTCLGVSEGQRLTLTAGDGNDSLLWSWESGQTEGSLHGWSPYGSGKAAALLPGFNGERCDPVSGAYHLGNGYRAYNPVLMRFNCPDSLSPFGAGGINPYAYCGGDPINFTDPSGHMSWQGILGIGLGILGLVGAVFTAGASIAAAGGIAAALESASAVSLAVGALGVVADMTAIASGIVANVDPQASAVLGWVSMASGLVGLGVGGLQAVRKATQATRQRLGNIRSTGLSGRGAVRAARQRGYSQHPDIPGIAVAVRDRKSRRYSMMYSRKRLDDDNIRYEAHEIIEFPSDSEAQNAIFRRLNRRYPYQSPQSSPVPVRAQRQSVEPPVFQPEEFSGRLMPPPAYDKGTVAFYYPPHYSRIKNDQVIFNWDDWDDGLDEMTRL
ncbi:RHS repeat protein [Serratia inhibens]|uniref:RHS repeat protein n=1 Tax=Serratia inhibens TaxID=2338073 RepID=A0AA92X4H3_9GAMM|nr:RHS repeat-associated core domain-containing protein [Serratia inhibens]RJF54727.1 RHS repeat protein [Serratia inhibens]